MPQSKLMYQYQRWFVYLQDLPRIRGTFSFHLRPEFLHVSPRHLKSIFSENFEVTEVTLQSGLPSLHQRPSSSPSHSGGCGRCAWICGTGTIVVSLLERENAKISYGFNMFQGPLDGTSWNVEWCMVYGFGILIILPKNPKVLWPKFLGRPKIWTEKWHLVASFWKLDGPFTAEIRPRNVAGSGPLKWTRYGREAAKSACFLSPSLCPVFASLWFEPRVSWSHTK